MSHVAQVEIEVKDLDALKTACKRLGLTFVEGQKTYAWYGRWVNDYDAENAAYRYGIPPEDYGKCEHAITAPSAAYEIGVVRRRDGKPGYALIYDNWNRGGGLEAYIGRDAKHLVNAYAEEIVVKQLRRQGCVIERRVLTNGTVQIVGHTR